MYCFGRDRTRVRLERCTKRCRAASHVWGVQIGVEERCTSWFDRKGVGLALDRVATRTRSDRPCRAAPYAVVA